nr:sigma-70 family RNA polymerase sigma factor [Sulfobacillus harzensis]
MNGDREAFAVLIEPHLNFWIRMAAAWLGSVQDGEDAVQNALVQCYQHLGQFHRRAKFSTWATRIVIRECCRIGRDRDRGVQFLDRREAAEPGFEGVVALETTLGDVLNSEERELFRLAVAEGRSWADVGRLTGMSSGAAKTKWWRARRRLKAALWEGESLDD